MIITSDYPCPLCGETAEVQETLRAFKGGELPPPMEALDKGLLMQGRIKLTCPKCGRVTDKMWSCAVDCQDLKDPKAKKVYEIYMNRMRETWERMRRGEPEPDPGPSNCEYITFEGMYY